MYCFVWNSKNVPKKKKKKFLDGRQACDDVSGQLNILSLPLGNVKISFLFYLGFYNANKDHNSRIVDQNSINLVDDVVTTIRFVKNEVVFTYISIRSLINTLGRVVEQYALALAIEWWWSQSYRILRPYDRDLVLAPWWWLMKWYAGLHLCQVWFLEGFWKQR